MSSIKNKTYLDNYIANRDDVISILVDKHHLYVVNKNT